MDRGVTSVHDALLAVQGVPFLEELKNNGGREQRENWLPQTTRSDNTPVTGGEWVEWQSQVSNFTCALTPREHSSSKTAFNREQQQVSDTKNIYISEIGLEM